jgi:hypothetical protein
MNSKELIQILINKEMSLSRFFVWLQEYERQLDIEELEKTKIIPTALHV